MRKTFIPLLAAAAASALLAVPAHSASVSYVLNESTTLPDGVDYLRVTLSDGRRGTVKVKVQVLPALAGQGSASPGIEWFAINVPDAAIKPGLHQAGVKRTSIGGFGPFEYTARGAGKPELDFTIRGTSVNALVRQFKAAGGNATTGPVYFAAEVTGLASSSSAISYFSGPGSLVAVPVPPAAWLFGSALGLVVPMRRRMAS